MQDGSRTVKGNNYCSLWPDLSAVVIQSPSILRAPQLARSARGATAHAAGIPFRFRPHDLSTVSVYFTRVHGHSLTPVPAYAC